MLFRKKRSVGNRLSAYLDGELGGRENEEMGERLIFDSRCGERLQDYRKVTEMMQAALAPQHVPDSAAFADQLVERVAKTPLTPFPRRSRRLVKPAVLASFGLVLTAGLALMELKRRGRV